MHPGTGEIFTFGDNDELAERLTESFDKPTEAETKKLKADLEDQLKELQADPAVMEKFKESLQPNFFWRMEKEPNPQCKKCYGRGHTGRNVKTNLYVPCKCVGAIEAVPIDQMTDEEKQISNRTVEEQLDPKNVE